MNHPAGLLADGLHDAGMGMAQGVYTQSSYEVEIFLAFEVVKVHTLATLKAHGIAIVGGEQKALFKIDNFIETRHGFIVNRRILVRCLRRGKPRLYYGVETRLAASLRAVPAALSGSSAQY